MSDKAISDYIYIDQLLLDKGFATKVFK